MRSLTVVENSEDLLFTAYCKLATDARELSFAATQDICRAAQIAWTRFAGQHIWFQPIIAIYYPHLQPHHAPFAIPPAYHQNRKMHHYHQNMSPPYQPRKPCRQCHLEGIPRSSGTANRKTHRHAGRKDVVANDDGTTEASFLRTRRLPQVGQSGARDSLDFNVEESKHWTDGHAQELDFAHKKAGYRKLQAQHEGSLLATEEASIPAGAAQHQVVKMLQGVEGRRRLARRQQSSQSGGAALGRVQGLRAFAAVDVNPNDSALRKLRLVWVDNILNAEVLVTIQQATGKRSCSYKNPQAWVAALKGLFLLTLSPTSSSSSSLALAPVSLLKFKAATRLPSSVYTTNTFREAHPEHAKLLRKCMKGTKWQALDNRRDYAAAVAGPRSRKVIALISGADDRRAD